MSNNNESYFEPTSNPEWGILDCLDPIQLGFLYESLMKNANDMGMNANSSKSYLIYAAIIKEAIDSNCGWDDYVEFHQSQCRKMADYDGRMGY